MAILTELIMSLSNMVKPEIRRAREDSVRMITFWFIGLGLLLGGAGLLAWGLYIVLMSVLGPMGAALISGGIAFVAGLIIIYVVRRNIA